MFDRNLWKERFTFWPTWPCPRCRSVALSIPKVKPQLIDEETGPSKRAHSDEAWDPDWIEKRFIALLRCHNPACGEIVSVSGSVFVDMDHYYDENGDTQTQYEDVYKPSYFTDAPPIFAVPEECPQPVSKQLESSFALIWCDTAAAANRLRAGVEALLDNQNIQKTTLSKNRTRERLTTHSRIEKLMKKDKEAADYLMAIKWLGYIGSHDGHAIEARSDILDALSLFEAAIERLYLKKAEKFARLAAAISKRKGKPAKHRRKRN